MPLPSLYGIAPDWAPFALAGAEGSCVPVWWWLGFGLLMLLLVATDLLTVHRLERDPSMVGSAATVAVCCLLALVFNAVIGWQMGGKAALQFSTGYLLEWSLSMDNIFVFAVIFRYFQVPKVHQYRILHWGIVGAILTRLTFILAGAALISRFQFILPLLGLFLIYTAWQLARRSTQRSDPRRNLVFRFARRWLPLAEESGSVGFSPPVHEGGPRPTLQSPQTPESVESPTAAVDYGGRFLVRQAGRLQITPPLLVLLVVESTDVLFAVDSVPAIFGVTHDPFLVFTSNVFAILGLRALYFLLAGVMDRFRYLHYGLAAVLAFVGLKMAGEGWAGKEVMPAWASLAVIVALLGAAVVASMRAGKKEIAN
jgi:tellurite resistance protein TerC